MMYSRKWNVNGGVRNIRVKIIRSGFKGERNLHGEREREREVDKHTKWDRIKEKLIKGAGCDKRK